MNLRLIDWIWHVRGSLALAPEQSKDEAFDRLEPLFHQGGTSHERANGLLRFSKKDQAAQDKMSIFDGGVLQIEHEAARPVLRYDLTSRALLACFLAPLLFLGFAQLTIAVGKFQTEPAESRSESGKASAKEEAPRPLNPIDKALGAPEPEKPDKDGKDGAKKKDRKPSPTAAYVFAGIFATLYVVGRVLEDRLIKGLFRKKLLGA
ncbi:hypothetical protein [Novosphingobium beihaiensis]|uniref:Uncharacterized protein n=1 Tax=Novosphingobium beihaiensis TaxID=2930389 RepID=A0ABT0BKD3_9SPHN|nr:hypothetical protein [Novosphingobium beihaiensis]MCJ2185494.1 hypothetical protein [Novosphingobium beihaiensis]